MYQGRTVAALLAAGGSGSRVGGPLPKLYRSLSGVSVLGRSLQALAAHPYVDRVYVSLRAGDEALFRELAAPYGGQKLQPPLPGGAERQDSVAAALRVLADAEAPDSILLVHDGARPLLSGALIGRVTEAAAACGAAIPVLPLRDTVKQRGPDGLLRTPPRSSLMAAQTPQGFRLDLLLEAYRQAEADGFLGTDDASLLERLGRPVQTVEGEQENLKITLPEDLAYMEWLIERRNDA